MRQHLSPYIFALENKSPLILRAGGSLISFIDSIGLLSREVQCSKSALSDRRISRKNFESHSKPLYHRSPMKKQIAFLKKEKSAYGGVLQKTRRGRKGPRPISTRKTMHLVLRSSQAKGIWSFLKPQNKAKIIQILKRFAFKYGIKIISAANVGNHLHLHIQIANRFTYKPFIRAVTGAIAMAITKTSRWSKLEKRFWDCRPFTRVVESLREFLNLRDYIRINKLEGQGMAREVARYLIKGTGSNRDNSRFKQLS